MPDRQSARSPNVVMIYMDDLAWGDLACHGNPYVRTPHLDRLHAQSTRLTQYRSGPVCTPARASLMTGRDAYRTRAIDTYCGRSMMEPEEVTLAETLRDAGYATGISGKWHLGDCYPTRAIDQGFDHALVHNGGGLCQPANWGRNDYFSPDLMRNGELVSSEGYCTDIFTDDALEFIEAHKNAPFFCYLATNAPHVPLLIEEKWYKHYLDKGLCEKFAKLYGMVENIDHNVGRVLDKLDTLHLADDTIVIFSSDHGPCMGAHDETHGDRWNGGLNARKGTPYDGGLRVPFLIRWPGVFEAGQDIDRIAGPIDVMPTLASVCGAKLPEDRVIDGVDLSPLLRGETSPEHWPGRQLVFQWHRGDAPVPYRNFALVEQRWKLLCANPGPTRNPHEPKNMEDLEKGIELYDIAADPQEQHNLAAQHPDVVERMKRDYERWFEDVTHTRADATFDPPAIHVGAGAENPTVLTRQDWRMYGEVDSFTQGPPGFWHVDVRRAGTYTVRLRLPERDGDAELRFKCGDTEHTDTVPADRAQWTLENVTLNGGVQALEAQLHIDGEAHAPKFVDVFCDEMPQTGTVRK